MLNDFDHPGHCPACGSRFDGVANMSGMERPQPGDPCICIFCQTINVMGDDGEYRFATPDEYIEFMADERIQMALAAMRFLGPPPSSRR